MHPLNIMNNEDTGMGLMIITFTTALSETAGEIIGKHHHHQKNNNNKNPGSLQKFLICATKGSEKYK